ncbi:MAG: hypothetical protein J6C77_06885 [Muribaculaceae bacterium]|nr:hypothetical protein [Muribaculaceae bacterium]
MKKFLVLATLLCCMPAVRAFDPSKQLVIQTFPEGTVVFVNPSEMAAVKGTSTQRDMQYDVTANTLSDSVSFTCTVYTGQPLNADSAYLRTPASVHASAIELIYCEPKSNGWISRVRFYISASRLSSLLTVQTAPHIVFGATPDAPAFTLSDKKWDERRRVLSIMLEVLRQNNRQNR